VSTKYAIVNIFGRQFKVREGDKVCASFIDTDVGTTVSLSEVYLVNNGSEVKIGAPVVAGAKVTAVVEGFSRGDKVIVFKYLRKNKHKKLRGHRQPYAVLNITSIEG
jgi:large subunit ribosomal protein L21